MFIILLRFSANKSSAAEFLESHKAWIKRGMEDGIFLLVGTLQPNAGGCILAHCTTLPELTLRVNNDPFVSENVVSAEIFEITPNLADERMKFMLETSAP